MLTTLEYYNRIKSIYQKEGSPERAEKQMAYIRNQFAYYGLRSPEWVAILKVEFKNNGTYSNDSLSEFISLCYNDEYREMNYAAIQMVEKVQKNEKESFIELLEYMIIHKSWWDTVDWLAKLVGKHFIAYPDLIIPTTSRWIRSDNMWLNRTALIFQLFYRDKTDIDLLFSYVLIHKESKEFFIQKAMGWALRQYSRIDAQAILQFIESNEDLPKLTKKEAVRLIV